MQGSRRCSCCGVSRQRGLGEGGQGLRPVACACGQWLIVVLVPQHRRSLTGLRVRTQGRCCYGVGQGAPPWAPALLGVQHRLRRLCQHAHAPSGYACWPLAEWQSRADVQSHMWSQVSVMLIWVCRSFGFAVGECLVLIWVCPSCVWIVVRQRLSGQGSRGAVSACGHAMQPDTDLLAYLLSCAPLHLTHMCTCTCTRACINTHPTHCSTVAHSHAHPAATCPPLQAQLLPP